MSMIILFIWHAIFQIHERFSFFPSKESKLWTRRWNNNTQCNNSWNLSHDTHTFPLDQNLYFVQYSNANAVGPLLVVPALKKKVFFLNVDCWRKFALRRNLNWLQSVLFSRGGKGVRNDSFMKGSYLPL